MLIAGAGGFALQVLATLHALGQTGGCVFFDDISKENHGPIAENFTILKTVAEAGQFLKEAPSFVLAIGNPRNREQLCQRLEGLGGRAHTLIDPSVRISPYSVSIGEGTCALQDVIIEPGVQIGKGVLLNIRALVTHDCRIGDFSEISPAAVLLGGCQIGEGCMIGAGAVILPRVRIGNFAVIGAGAVVTADVNEGETRVGVPARLK